MVKRILIDISHYETIRAIPENFLPSREYLFSFNSIGDTLTDLDTLLQYDLIICGNPVPKYRDELLFTSQELRALKEYMKFGGNLLISSANRGDFNFPNSTGSLRVLYNITGVVQFAYALLYSRHPKDYAHKKSNFIYQEFPTHPIFEEFTEGEKIILGDSTYLTTHPDIPATVLLQTPPTAWQHDYKSKQKEKLGQAPVMVVNEYKKGKCISLGSSSFLTTDPENGVKAAQNAKFVAKMFDWLLSD